MTAWRTSPLPKNWPSVRKMVLTRDAHTCQIQGPRCTTGATEVDHIGRADDHRAENLRAVCRTCHASKTGKDAAKARGPRPSRARPREQGHPGLL
ncbi:HNH endonuclease [Actinocorallia sp. API 0066]|uniref:HNH endonuclease n=1 Tax=Actinocorallia sp. API 0066 TaxID=2896846 RepID=UPI001E2DDABA|nr:HNH endonuclease signature motif containing protein [Actinocorallia sp. API 0066]MCD0450780.1 HNH endonuclease [Actinocorallia sp. API 0066]